MNPQRDQEIFVAILAGTILFLLFSGFIIAYVMIYWRRRRKHEKELERMKLLFNEELLKSRLEMKEQTLQDVSEEIHDNVGQKLTLAKVQLNIMEQVDGHNNTHLAEVKETISQAMTDLRSIATTLNTQKIQVSSLLDIVQNHISRVSRVSGIEMSFTAEGTEHQIDDPKKLILFRIIQESLQNIIKHSKATLVEITFKFNSANLEIAISDNGSGFDVERTWQGGDGLGLQNMKNRANLIGGKLDIASTIDKGTRLFITAPYV